MYIGLNLIMFNAPVRALFAVTSLVLAAGPATAGAVTVRSGHLDVGPVLVGDRLTTRIRDASDGVIRSRAVADVQLRLGARARSRLPSGVGAVGAAGSRVWTMPQQRRSGVPWLGWSTERLDGARVRSPVAWTLEAVRGPGRVGLFQTNGLGRQDVLFSSARRRPGTRTVPVGTHAHGTWTFSAAGAYRLRFRWTATRRSGAKVSDRSTLRVRVG